KEVRLERMRPAAIDAAKKRNPSIYVPCGSVEWHGIQNPVGLDTMKAHEQLVGLASRVGGLVYPSIFLGAGGGHTEWPHSYMVEAEPMVHIITTLLHHFERDGYHNAIFLSGHYPNRTEYLDKARDRYRAEEGKMRVLTLIENEVPEGRGDHAALIETSFMLYLHPELVAMDLLGPPENKLPGSDQTPHNWMGKIYAGHPLYGQVGLDPRGQASAELGGTLTEGLISYLVNWLAG
ncbi:MAG: creatininase family protein, partial [Anaerolineae bacterium]|nr:creatininase family protein [Anaerolineae bacterium]